MNYRHLLYFDGPNTLEEVTRQRDILAEAIAKAAHEAGIYNAETQIGGPHLLMFLDDLRQVACEAAQQVTCFDVEDNGFFGSFKPFPPSAGFEHLQPNIRGIWVDGEWKKAMEAAHPTVFSVPAQGLDYDGSRIVAHDGVHDVEFCDVKFLTKIKKTSYKTSADVYISHNEYKFDRANNTVFEIVFLEDGLIKHLTSFTFNEAKELGAITLYPEGRAVIDRETGKPAMPWCIDVLTVRPELESRLVEAYKDQ